MMYWSKQHATMLLSYQKPLKVQETIILLKGKNDYNDDSSGARENWWPDSVPCQ